MMERFSLPTVSCGYSKRAGGQRWCLPHAGIDIILLCLYLFFSGCNKDSTSSDNNHLSFMTFQSINVKNQVNDYFQFSSNKGSTTKPAEWDIAFATTFLTVERGPCQFFSISNDPLILSGPGITIARIDAADLASVTKVPASSMFTVDTSTSALIGNSWATPGNPLPNSDVYVIKTCEGGYGVIDIKSFDYNPQTHQLSNIKWFYKYNADGSRDFSATKMDSFTVTDSYTEPCYFKLGIGKVAGVATWDIKIDGDKIWLGQNVYSKGYLVSCLKIENTTLAEVSTVPAVGYQTDTPASYVTRHWYRYDNNHVLTPLNYVYVVNTLDGKYPAFKVISYYDEKGESGRFTIQWKYLK